MTRNDTHAILFSTLLIGVFLASAKAGGKHIFAPNGFLNDSWFHRAFLVLYSVPIGTATDGVYGPV